MCVRQRRHGANRYVPCWVPDRAHVRTALRRDLADTMVSGDVSGWQAMAHATYMCVHQPIWMLCACWGLIGIYMRSVLRRLMYGTHVTGCNSLAPSEGKSCPGSPDMTTLLHSGGSGWPS